MRKRKEILDEVSEKTIDSLQLEVLLDIRGLLNVANWRTEE